MTEGIAERRGGMAVLDEVVDGLLAAGIPGEPARVPQGVESVGAAGHDLVHIRLMSHIPDESVTRGVEDTMQGEGQLDHTKVGREMAPTLRNLVQDEGPDLLTETVQLSKAQRAQV
jgi:hypothetical protein